MKYKFDIDARWISGIVLGIILMVVMVLMGGPMWADYGAGAIVFTIMWRGR